MNKNIDTVAIMIKLNRCLLIQDQSMNKKITIRTYSKYAKGHTHDHHQILIPIRGFIDLKLNGVTASVSYGDCVVIKAGCYHEFRAREDFRFLIIDVNELPNKLNTIIPLGEAANNYVKFVENQLEFHLTPSVEERMILLLFDILDMQDLSSKIDSRIKNTIQYINQDISKHYTIDELAQVAFLSPTQFKFLFNKNIKLTPLKYLAKMRMERAKILLNNTDLPITRISEEVGFVCPSSFTRCFSNHYGQSPKNYRIKC